MKPCFFSPILEGPAAAIPLRASLALAARAPFVLETEDCSFDLESYARKGHAELSRREGEHAMLDHAWRGEKKTTAITNECAWLDVAWRGARYEVVRLAWLDGGSTQRRAYVLAESEAAANALFRAVCAHATATVQDEIVVFEDGGFHKSPELFRSIKSATFDSLVLAPALARSLRGDFASFFEGASLFAKYAVPWRRGALFVGPPGNGKTHAVKAIVGALGKPCVYVKSIVSRYETDHTAIRRIFRRARDLAPSILVLEDLDSIASEGNRSFLLNELDGFADNLGVATIATTNYADKLDPALVDRPSRFDRTYHFGLPDAARRAAFLSRWAEGLEVELRPSPASIAGAAETTGGFSFAYLKELGTSCLLAWMRDGGAMDAVLEEQAKQLACHVRRGDTSRVLGK